MITLGFLVWVRFGSATVIRIAPEWNLDKLNFWSQIAFAFGGLELGAIMGGEIRNPEKNVPRAAWIAGLGLRRDRSHLGETEAQGRQRADHGSILVEAGGQAHRVQELAPEDRLAQRRIAHQVAPGQQRDRPRHRLRQAQRRHAEPVRGLRIAAEQQRTQGRVDVHEVQPCRPPGAPPDGALRQAAATAGGFYPPEAGWEPSGKRPARWRGKPLSTAVAPGGARPISAPRRRSASCGIVRVWPNRWHHATCCPVRQESRGRGSHAVNQH